MAYGCVTSPLRIMNIGVNQRDKGSLQYTRLICQSTKPRLVLELLWNEEFNGRRAINDIDAFLATKMAPRRKESNTECQRSST